MAEADLTRIEAEIDAAFAGNKLSELPYAQCMWTLLSVAEDHHFKIIVYDPLAETEARIYIDGLMNSLTHPMRVCHSKARRGHYQFRRRLIGVHYKLANDWLESAEDYNHFCTIFPLYHANQITLSVRGEELIPSDWNETDLRYEVYDRFVLRRDPDSEVRIDPTPAANELEASMRTRRDTYSVDFTKRLVSKLVDACGPGLKVRFRLPESWEFAAFSLGQFRTVFICLQSLAAGWFLARQIAAARRTNACAYSSSVWTPKKSEFTRFLASLTGVREGVVASILEYMTFGEKGVRWPDIAIQPIVDLSNGEYAISPFMLLNVNAERNICVLLNQIPEERRNYSRLVDEKEVVARQELIETLSGSEFDFRFGRIDNGNVDLAIIDRSAKMCLCIEIKWFIEPAEVREVLDRSDEIAKGIDQALRINKLFSAKDRRLFELLEIDSSYGFMAMVGTVNFIGRHFVQHSDIPVTKLWHLGAQIKESGDLGDVFGWLRSRRYLPKREVDFKIRDVGITCGTWRAHWYGIKHA